MMFRNFNNHVENVAITTEELDDMMKTFKLLETKFKEEAGMTTEEPNKTNVFYCGICLDVKPLSTTRLLTPCGHVFCAECVTKLSGCPKCRGVIASVIKPYF